MVSRIYAFCISIWHSLFWIWNAIYFNMKHHMHFYWKSKKLNIRFLSEPYLTWMIQNDQEIFWSNLSMWEVGRIFVLKIRTNFLVQTKIFDCFSKSNFHSSNEQSPFYENCTNYALFWITLENIQKVHWIQNKTIKSDHRCINLTVNEKISFILKPSEDEVWLV
jgi:hypothetical protein